MSEFTRKLEELDDWEDDIRVEDHTELTILNSVLETVDGQLIEFGQLSDGTYFELDDTFLCIYDKDAHKYFKTLSREEYNNEWCSKSTKEIYNFQDQKYIDIFNQSKLNNAQDR